MTTSTANPVRYAGLVRRFMAIIYDLFLLVAILFIATVFAIALNRGESISAGSIYHAIYMVYLLAISFFYYGWFWTHGGQTLGMKTWKMKLTSTRAQQNISWKQSAIRFVIAQLSWVCAGAGYFWSIFDSQNRTWHDIISRSVLIDLRTSSHTLQ